MRTPDWQSDDGSVQLHCCDCAEVLPFVRADLLLTDPPYGIGLDMVTKHGTVKSIHHDADWNNAPPSPECFNLMYACSRNQIIWGCNYFGSNIRDVGRIVHDKELNIGGTALRYSEADLASCSLQKRITIFRYRWGGNVQGDTINWKNTGPDARVHPTQKPIALMRHCVETYSDPGDVIADPFMGSGTAGVACVRTSRKFIGVEREPRYFDIAIRRIKAELAQPRLFTAPAPKVKQEEMFK